MVVVKWLYSPTGGLIKAQQIPDTHCDPIGQGTVASHVTPGTSVKPTPHVGFGINTGGSTTSGEGGSTGFTGVTGGRTGFTGITGGRTGFTGVTGGKTGFFRMTGGNAGWGGSTGGNFCNGCESVGTMIGGSESSHTSIWTSSCKKPVFLVFVQVRLKPDCSATETS